MTLPCAWLNSTLLSLLSRNGLKHAVRSRLPFSPIWSIRDISGRLGIPKHTFATLAATASVLLSISAIAFSPAGVARARDGAIFGWFRTFKRSADG